MQLFLSSSSSRGFSTIFGFVLLLSFIFEIWKGGCNPRNPPPPLDPPMNIGLGWSGIWKYMYVQFELISSNLKVKYFTHLQGKQILFWILNCEELDILHSLGIFLQISLP